MPNRDNLHIYCFVIAGICGISFVLLNSHGQAAGGQSIILDILLSTMAGAFLLGMLAFFTRPKRFKTAQREAYQQAMQMLENLDVHAFLDNTPRVIRIIEIVQTTNSLNFGEKDLEELYDLVSADELPHYYRDEKFKLDWHKFDLCIISANRDMELARRIVDELREYHEGLRVFMDDEQTIDRQEELIKRNYYAGSRLCLALISKDLIRDDERRKRALGYARQREVKIRKDRNSISGRNVTYLKPIPLDESGLLFMKSAKDLAPFVEYFSLIQDRDQLFRVIVNCISEELRRSLYLGYSPSGKLKILAPTSLSDISYKVFISHSSKDLAFARHLYHELQARDINCWFAPVHMKIGESIRDAIENAIQSYCKMILILSENAMKSPWIQNEVELAFEKERDSTKQILFPIRIDNSIYEAKTAWARTLRRERHIGNFTNWESPGVFKEALKNLLLALQSEKE